MSKNSIFSGVKIVFSLVVSLIITIILSKTLFSFNTPRFNISYLVRLFPKNNYGKLATIPLSSMTQISKGIYAKEDKELKTVYIRVTKDAQWQEKIIESNGHKILLRYPL
jgi:uncharacterized protein YycO